MKLSNLTKCLSGLHGRLLLMVFLPVFLVIGSWLFVTHTLQVRELETFLKVNYLGHLQIMHNSLEREVLNNYVIHSKDDSEAAKLEVEEYLSWLIGLIPELKSLSVYRLIQDNKFISLASAGRSGNVQRELPPDMVRTITQNHILFLEEDSPEHWVASVYINSESGFKGVLFVEFSEVMANNYNLRETAGQENIVLFVLAGVILSYFMIYFFLIRVVINPSRAISEAVNEISDGRLGARVDIKGDNEIWRIGKAFNAMADAVMSTLESEKGKVRELNVMNEAVSELSTQVNMKLLLSMIVRHARNLIKSQYSFIFIKDTGSDNVNVIKKAEFDGLDDSVEFSVDTIRVSGFLEGILTDAEFVIENDIKCSSVELGLPEGYPPVRNFLAVPLVSGGAVLGLLGIANKGGGDFISQDEDIIFTFAIQSMMAIEKVMLFEETKKLSVTDGLTGLLNHREFQRKLEAEVERSLRYDRELTLLLLDIDYFKSFNDTYGHQFGDVVLKEVAQLIQKDLRISDLAARYGGEEFAVILPETGLVGTLESVAEKIRKKVAKHVFITSDKKKVSLTLSIGIASLPADAKSREKLISYADEALYYAKETGRNRVCDYASVLKAKINNRGRDVKEILANPEAEALDNLADAIDSRSYFTRGHSKKVADYALMLADTTDLTVEEKESLRVAGILHDIGTLSIPDEILSKASPLNYEEMKIIQAHPELAKMLLTKTDAMNSILPAILYHHERIDGKGYPNGLKGDEIPLNARILAIAEAFAAMTSTRPYREAMTMEQAVDILKQNAGTQFDADLVGKFLSTLLEKSNSDYS